MHGVQRKGHNISIAILPTAAAADRHDDVFFSLTLTLICPSRHRRAQGGGSAGTYLSTLTGNHRKVDGSHRGVGGSRHAGVGGGTAVTAQHIGMLLWDALQEERRKRRKRGINLGRAFFLSGHV